MSQPTDPLQELFDNNRRWVSGIVKQDPGFFKDLARQQHPEYLWIGCSDSRVPANTIVGLKPGEVFVHRNVANLVVHTDLNCLSVIQYAVDVLHVKHIIVCGHYGCGGIRAALANRNVGLVGNWLRHVQDLARQHETELNTAKTDEERRDLLCALNVRQQVANVCHTTVLQDAWRRKQPVSVHGLIYRIQDGLLNDLDVHISGPDKIPSVFRI